MKFIDEYRNTASAEMLIKEIHSIVTRTWTIMEICGGQTHTIVKSGIDELLPSNTYACAWTRMSGVRYTTRIHR